MPFHRMIHTLLYSKEFAEPCNTWISLYIVTEKVWESESTDASDSDTKTHDRGGGGAKGSLKLEQPSPARGTKQSLLVNFFKK